MHVSPKNGWFLLVFWWFDEAKYGVLVGLNKINCANNDEISQNCFGFSTVDARQFLEFLQRDLPMLGKKAEKFGFGFGKSDFGGSGRLLGFPHLN